MQRWKNTKQSSGKSEERKQLIAGTFILQKSFKERYSEQNQQIRYIYTWYVHNYESLICEPLENVFIPKLPK